MPPGCPGGRGRLSPVPPLVRWWGVGGGGHAVGFWGGAPWLWSCASGWSLFCSGGWSGVCGRVGCDLYSGREHHLIVFMRGMPGDR